MQHGSTATQRPSQACLHSRQSRRSVPHHFMVGSSSTPQPPGAQVLREELNCTLPIELVWHGTGEMDNATLVGLKKFFDPLEGYDVSTKPYPKHQRK